MPSEEMLVLDVQGLDKLVDEIKPKLHTHENEDILDEITAPFTTELLGKLDGIEDNANNYVLPIATTEILGGVKVGSGLVVDTDGVLSSIAEDTKVTQELTTESSEYPVLLAPSGQTSTQTTTAYFGTGMQYNPNVNNLSATSFTGMLKGNADTASEAEVAIKLGTETVGSTTTPIYLDAGTPTAFTQTVGSTTQPIFMSDGSLVASTETVGGSAKPVYLNNGVITGLSASVGSNTQPVYLDSGTLTVCDSVLNVDITGNAATADSSTNADIAEKIGTSSIGDATTPIYIDAGTPTACGSVLNVDITGNAGSADVATKLGSTTVGGTATPIYLDQGTATACSATVGSSTKPVYMASGTIAASDATVGSGTKPIYLSSGTLTASSSTAGGTATPVYLNSGTIIACSATVGSGTTPVYMSSGTIAASTSTIGSGTKPMYLSSGVLTESSSTVGSTTQPVYLSSGTITAMSGALATTYGGTGNTSGRATYLNITATNPTSGTTYYPTWVTGTSSGTNYAANVNNGLRYNTLEGTTSDVGYGRLYLGNSTASGTAGNKYGAIMIYDNSGYYYLISGNQSALTANRTLYLPTVTATSRLVAATNGSAVGSSTTPVYINSSGVATACTLNGIASIKPYFCLWYSATSAPPENEDLTAATCGVAVCGTTICGLTGDLWSTTEPSDVAGAYKWVKYLITYNDGTTSWDGPYFRGYLSKAGGTVTGQLNVETSSNPGIRLTNTGTSTGTYIRAQAYNENYVSLGLNSSGTNRGIYDGVVGGWMFYRDSDNAVHVGTSTVGGSSQPIYLSSGVPTACNSISTSVDATLTSSGWSSSSPYTQSVTVSGVTASTNGLVGVAQSATATQREAARSAMLSITAQASNTVTITADGDKPSVDIPIQIIILG